MAMKFSEQSPVFAKRQPLPAQQQPPRPSPQYPVYGGSAYPTPYPTPYPQVAAAASTPYPVTNNPYYPMPQAGQAQPSYMSSGSGNFQFLTFLTRYSAGTIAHSYQILPNII